ncbi:MAG: T9SS type A sorting domain-containing protein [Flavobacteriales bacterium]|nr:T9SS type A sorting domain-containing protein [Flavobacteriales bacterium]
MKRAAVSIICFCLFLMVGKAQNPQWVVYDTSDSPLLSNGVYAIQADGLGNKWIGARAILPGGGGGLCKLNKGVWTVFDTSNSDIPFNQAEPIAVDTDNNIWLGSSGLVKFDGTDWTRLSTTFPSLFKAFTGIVIDANNDKWLGTYDELLKFDGSTVTSERSSVLGFDIGPVAIDVNDHIWLAHGFADFTSEGYLDHFDGVNWTSHYLSSSAITLITFDALGDLWLGLSDSGIAKFDGSDFTIYSSDNSGIPGNRATSIAVDQNENKWIGLRGMGLIKFDGTNWTVYNTSNSGLPDNWVNTLYIDTYDNKWIGTENGGVAVFNELGVGIENAGSGPSFQQLTVHPNPASELITISFNVASVSDASLNIYDVSGRIVANIDQDIKPSQEHSFDYDVSELINGVYYIRLTTEGFAATHKLVVTK